MGEAKVMDVQADKKLWVGSTWWTARYPIPTFRGYLAAETRALTRSDTIS